MKSDLTATKTPPTTIHSIWLRVVGFVLAFIAALLAVVGGLLALLGFGGHLLVRARPDSGQNINYDPGTIALLSPIPIFAGMLLLGAFLVIANRLGASRR